MLRKVGVFAASLFVCALMSIQPAQAARGTPMYKAEPIPVGKADAGQVRNAVRKALIRRNWDSKEKGPGHIVATYSKPKFNVTIDITYDSKAVKIKYKNSDGLRYSNEGGEEVIHKNYNNWIKNLEKDINFELSEFN